MGEYAQYNGHQIKIGTCESMYYLRADQMHQVTGYRFSADVLKVIRFRFPFPDEDGNEPGDFEDYHRGFRVDGAREVLAMIDPDDHYRVQFKADHGYLVSLPCPEIGADDGFDASKGLLTLTDGSEHPYEVGRNGFGGALFVKQQRYWGGQLVTVMGCACGALWRLETLAQAEPVIVALRSMADRYERSDEPARAQFCHDMADRITVGYALETQDTGYTRRAVDA